MLRESTMSSVEHLKQVVRGRLEAAAEEIFAVFHRLIVDYEAELDRHRKIFDATWKPVVKLHRTELPQQVFIKEEVIEEGKAPLNQDKNTRRDQEEPEPPKLEEQQLEESSLELGLKQEPEDLQLGSAEVERNKNEDQTMGRQSEEPDFKIVGVTSLVSEATRDLQQCSLSTGVSSPGAQTEGDLEFKSKIHCVSITDHENLGPGSASPCGTSLQHQVMRENFVCQDCGKRFSYKSRLKRHKRTHTGEKPYVCQTCGKRFSQKYHLKVHKLIHAGEKPHVCHTCGMRFVCRQYLNLHQRIHLDEKPHVCNTCGKSFGRLDSFKIHKKIHTDERPYVCNTCGKGFRRRTEFVEHKRTHTGERPFVCSTCGKSFARGASLNIHKKIHTGERPYVCDICDKGYIRLDTLKKHKRSHTGERPWVCDLCDKSYVRPETLKKHKRTHTGE